jgi:prepilin-type N-terminal cleavage/methylation domain-containing protein
MHRVKHPHHNALVAELRDQRGFSLVEVVLATAIAVIAVVGLAYTFGIGRGLIGRYEIARTAMGVAQARIESFAALPTSQITPGSMGAADFTYKGEVVGLERWDVNWKDEPFDSLGGQDLDGPQDLKLVTVSVSWGSGITADSVTTSRLFPRQ